MPIIKPFNCHCVPAGPGYSGDTYDNPYDFIDGCASGRCIDEVFATIYQMDFNYVNDYSPGRPCCPKYRQRYYNLYYNTSLSDGGVRKCIFQTQERAGLLGIETGVCTDSGYLATFTISEDLDISALYYFTVLIHYETDGFGGAPTSIVLRYSSDFSGNPINCLSTITLPLTSTVTPIIQFNQYACIDVGGTVPSTITLTPV